MAKYLLKSKGAILGALFVGIFTFELSSMAFAAAPKKALYEEEEQESVIVPTEEIEPELEEEEEELILSVMLTSWQYYESTHPRALEIYSIFSEAVDEEGNRLYSNEFIMGLLANVMGEGSSGEVERAFARAGQYGFQLPSGEYYITTVEDIDYLLDWQITDEGTMEDCVRKGSCGVSVLQWSFSRRITYLNILKSIVAERLKCEVADLPSDTRVIAADLGFADREMFLTELKPGGKYLSLVEGAMDDWCRVREGADGAAEYAEAICDFYVCPKYCDGDMSGTGASCMARREFAAYLWGIYSDNTSSLHRYRMDKNGDWVEIFE